MTLDPERSARWLAALHERAPADRPTAEAAVRRLYSAGGVPATPRVCWFDSPWQASWAVAVLAEHYSPAWPLLLGAARQSSRGREQIAAAAASLCAGLGVGSLAEVLAIAGGPLSPHLGFGAGAAGFHQAWIAARMKVHGGAAALFSLPSPSDALAAAQSALLGGNDRGVLTSGLFAPTTGTLIGYSYCNDYSWSAMARDEEVAGPSAPDILREAWAVAFASGPWWPFQGVAVLTERPAELHVSEAGLPHRGDGPAVVYRDGWSVFAWNGKPIEAAWILHPETIPPASLRRADAEFRRLVESRVGRVKPSKPPKPSSLLAKPLPLDPLERVDLLRTQAGGRLPLLDRYLAGEHVQVWRELSAHGAAVRADPLAADALAVAGETMRRVALNVETLVSRLRDMGYVFTFADFRVDGPHIVPARETHKQIARIEKRAGPLPLSLRAFYEMVGAVCLVGRHPRLAPDRGSVAVDPLWVYGVDDALESIEAEEDASEIVLAPDDIHKAGESGGDPYAIELPNPGADAPLSNARYRVGFVEYLRLAFRYGGFPGYDGIDQNVPTEIVELGQGLLSF